MKIKSGFTIIEIIVVIGIIAILTAIVLPSINNIRAKNRDTERLSDISTLQLGLSLYFSQHQTGVDAGYPKSLPDLLPGKYVPADALTGPKGEPYTYVPLTRDAGGTKCTFYHLGTVLELQSAQIDPADHFNSTSTSQGTSDMGGYYWCGNLVTSGLVPGPNNYNVHP